MTLITVLAIVGVIYLAGVFTGFATASVMAAYALAKVGKALIEPREQEKPRTWAFIPASSLFADEKLKH